MSLISRPFGPLSGLVAALLLVLGLTLGRTPSFGADRTPGGEPQATLCDALSAVPPTAAGDCDPERVLQTVGEELSGRPPFRLDHLLFHTARKPLEDLAAAEAPSFRPRADLPEWPLVLPIDWAADPFGDRNWRYQLNAWRAVEPYLVLYDRTGERRFLEVALALVRDWVRFHVVEDRPNPFGWYDMAVGLRALSLAYLLDRGLRAEGPISPPDLALLVRTADLHLDRLLEPGFITPSNHGLFQLHGAMGLCRALPQLRRCPEARAYVEKELAALLTGQFNLELMHLEHSPEYHFFAARQVDRILDSGWYEGLSDLSRLLDLIAANGRWLVHPDGGIVRVGDTSRGRPSTEPPEGDPSCRDATGFRSECHRARPFYETGYAVVRSDWSIPAERASMLFFTAAFHSRTHKHADDLSFELFESGRRVLVDAGKYSYQRDAMRDYVTSARAHNTVEVDGRDPSLDLESAYGSGLRGLYRFPWGFVLDGEVEHPDLGARHRRVLLYRPGEWLVVLDRLGAERTASFTQWFHLSPELEIDAGRDGRLEARAPDGFEMLVERSSNASGCGSDVARGQREPRLQGWMSEAYGDVVPNWAVGYRCEAREATLVAALRFHDVPDGASPLTVSFAGSSRLELAFHSHGPVRVTIDLDDPAAVRVDAPGEADR